MAYSKIEQLVYELAEPLAAAVKTTVWDVEYKKEGKTNVLRVYIDKTDGVGINDCEAVSVALSAKLDELDPIPSAYSLEVSSAGLDRRLKRESDFLQYIGHLVDVKLYAPQNGLKDFTAELVGYVDGTIRLRYEEQVLELSMDAVASVRLAVVF